jgi:uncharacterized protein YcbK (DUF882 family)
VRAGYRCGLATLLVLVTCDSLQNAIANGDTRTVSFHHVHTGEDLTITYKRDGRYDNEALKKINWALRDWRRDEPTTMDPHLIDLIWAIHREVGAKEPVHVIGGFRAPATNAMLRRRSRGVAKFSLHMRGKALDFFIPGVPLDELRNAGLRLQRGGVGFYPSSGSPFVHMDTGSVRHWPRLPPQLLAQVLESKPKVQLAGAERQPQPGLLARIFRPAPKDEAEDEEVTAPATTPARPPATAPTRLAATTAPRQADAIEAMPDRTGSVPLPTSRPAMRPQPSTFQLAAASSKPIQPARPAHAAGLAARALSPNDIIGARGFWQGLPADPAPEVSAAARAPTGALRPATGETDAAIAASMAPWALPDRRERAPDGVLAYAPDSGRAATPAQPLGSPLTRLMPAAIAPDTTVALKRRSGQPTIIAHALPQIAKRLPPKVGDRADDPWMRAMVVSQSASAYMRTTLFGMPDFRNLAPQFHKPTTSVMMTFSVDPHLGMRADRFGGTAVVFVSTVTFGQRTAMLRY